MSSQKYDYTPSKLTKNYEHQTTTLSYGRQNTDRKQVEELKDRSNQNPTPYQPNRQNRQNKYPQTASRLMDRQNMSLMREYEALKLKVRQLQAQNKHLQSQLDKTDYERCYLQKQHKQKMAFEQQSLVQFQKQKSYQLQLLQIKHEQELTKTRRQYDLQLDDLQKQIKGQQYSNRQKIQQINYLQIRSCQLKKQLQSVQRQLIKSRQNNSSLNQRLAREEFSCKKTQSLLSDVERQRNEMEMEIHVLLDIQAEKSRAINCLEVQLCNTEASERSLQEKVSHLTENFTDLESHINLMKERLGEAGQHVLSLERDLAETEADLKQNQLMIRDLKERELQLREQLASNLTKMGKREKEVDQLMAENQRLYRELNKTRHQLHQVSINHGIDV